MFFTHVYIRLNSVSNLIKRLSFNLLQFSPFFLLFCTHNTSINSDTQPPVVYAGNDTIVYVNQSIQLHGTGTDNVGVIEYAWKIDNSRWIITATGDTTIQSPSLPKIMICSLRVKDSTGNYGYDEIKITIDSIPVAIDSLAPVVNAGNDTIVRVNQSLLLRGVGTDNVGIIEYAWKIDTSTWKITSTGDTTIQVPSIPGSIICSLRVKDSAGNYGYDDKKIRIITLPLIECPLDIIWSKTINTNGCFSKHSVVQTEDNGFILGFGYIEKSMPGKNFIKLVKLDQNGDSLWTNLIELSKANQGGAHTVSVRQLKDNGFLIFACTMEDGGTVIKTNQLGEELWRRGKFRYPPTLTNDNGMVFVSSNENKKYLVKFNSSGDTLWSNEFEDNNIRTLGQQPIKQTADGGLIICGSICLYKSNEIKPWIELWKGSWLSKTDLHGKLLWTKTYERSNPIIIGHTVETCSDGGYIILGSGVDTNISIGSIHDVALIKVDGNGALQWTTNIGGIGHDYGYSIIQGKDDGFVITGNSYESSIPGQLFCIKIKSNGVYLWRKVLDRGTGMSIDNTYDNGYILSSQIYTSEGEAIKIFRFSPDIYY